MHHVPTLPQTPPRRHHHLPLPSHLKCIYKKLSDDEMDCCPVCYVDLGCLPLQKLRPDHNLQDIRAKIFPFRRRKIDAPQVVPSITLPAKRKERSLSSLVVNAPKVSNQTGFTGKRTKSGTRKAAEETYGEHNLGSFVADPSKKRPNEDTENSMELAEGKGDLWTPLNCLVEAANRTKSSKSNSQGTPHAKLESPSTAYGGLDMVATTTKSDLPTSLKSAFHMVKTKIKDNRHKRFGADKEGHTLHSGSAVKQKRPLRPVQERAEASETSASDTTGSRCDGKNSPIWFSLVASEDQKGDVPLPQISACYLRIKDGTVPVSFIQKYLVKKLNLTNEAEVEIMCRGQPVLPNLQLHNLVDLWFCSGSTTKKMPASVGSSAKDFVMVLSYCRKVVPH
nr:E3 ubiquitin protein ligase DRIP2 isoform X2 [Arachis hypogaea]